MKDKHYGRLVWSVLWLPVYVAAVTSILWGLGG